MMENHIDEPTKTTCRIATREMIFYVAVWMVILTIAYFIGCTDTWTLLIISDGWWGAVGIAFFWPRKAHKKN